MMEVSEANVNFSSRDPVGESLAVAGCCNVLSLESIVPNIEDSESVVDQFERVQDIHADDEAEKSILKQTFFNSPVLSSGVHLLERTADEVQCDSNISDFTGTVINCSDVTHDSFSELTNFSSLETDIDSAALTTEQFSRSPISLCNQTAEKLGQIALDNSPHLTDGSSFAVTNGHPNCNNLTSDVQQDAVSVTLLSIAQASSAEKEMIKGIRETLGDCSSVGTNISMSTGSRFSSRPFQSTKCRKTGPRRVLSNGGSLPLTHYFGSMHSNTKSDSVDVKVDLDSCSYSETPVQEKTCVPDGAEKTVVSADVLLSSIDTKFTSIKVEKESHFEHMLAGAAESIDKNIMLTPESKFCNTDSARKQPKAKKTCHISMDSSPAKLKTSENRSTRAKIGFSRNVGGFQTVTLAELEKALGIEGQSIEKIDARTFDRMIISKMQEKFVSRNGLSGHKVSSFVDKGDDASGSGDEYLSSEANSPLKICRVLHHSNHALTEFSSTPHTATHSKRDSDERLALSPKMHSVAGSDTSDGGQLNGVRMTNSSTSVDPETSDKFISTMKRRRLRTSSWARGSVVKKPAYKKKASNLHLLGKQEGGNDSAALRESTENISCDQSSQSTSSEVPKAIVSPARYVAKKVFNASKLSLSKQRAQLAAVSVSDLQSAESDNAKLEVVLLSDISESNDCNVIQPNTQDKRESTKENQLITFDSKRVVDNILCSCKLPGPMMPCFVSIHFCQALDCIDGKVSVCGSRVSNSEPLRPSGTVPYMVMCEHHRQQLRLHLCCAGCGQFCTQGRFIQCKPGHGSTIHHFHRQCQVFMNNKYHCPHCGLESTQYEALVRACEVRPSAHVSPDDSVWQDVVMNKNARLKCKRPHRAESIHSNSGSLTSAASISTQSNDHTSNVDHSSLDLALASLDKEKMKKIRVCFRSLLSACKLGDVDKVLYIMSEGVDPCQKSDDTLQLTALHVAAKAGYHQIVYFLLLAGANPNEFDGSMATPLMVAAENGHVDVIDLLLSGGAKAHTKLFKDGMTVLHLAAKGGHTGAVRLLLEKQKLDVNAKDNGGWTPLIWATEHRYLDTVQYLLSRGGNPNIRDAENNTGLHWAAYAGSATLAQIFLDAGCHVDSPNEHGDRPLHIAARQDHIDCVKLLLMSGASTEVLNAANETPLMCCLEANSKVAVALRRVPRLQTGSTFTRNRERFIHRDISLGRETQAIAVVNSVDDSDCQPDFLYVSGYVETMLVQVNRIITSLHFCTCTDNCVSDMCTCSHQSVKNWYDNDGRLISNFNFSDPPLIFECNLACRCATTCNNRVVQQGITCWLQVFKTNGRGWGCRTVGDIPRGTFVCEYAGELITDAEADRREDDSYLFDLDNQESDTYCIDAARYGNVSRFINHLCEPNLIPVKVFVDHQDMRFPRMCFFANRDIKAYEELGFDYGDKFWMIKYKQFTCSCGSSKCRYSKDTIESTIEEFNRREQEEDPAHEN